jgi:menaquinone-specific isochorismate synthase
MMAGCGIVADSDPLIEAREAQIKMLPIRDALEG